MIPSTLTVSTTVHRIVVTEAQTLADDIAAIRERALLRGDSMAVYNDLSDLLRHAGEHIGSLMASVPDEIRATFLITTIEPIQEDADRDALRALSVPEDGEAKRRRVG